MYIHFQRLKVIFGANEIFFKLETLISIKFTSCGPIPRTALLNLLIPILRQFIKH